MLVFPQFGSGSGAQYPLVKVRRTRTVTTIAPSGRLWRLGDPEGARLQWRLELNGLSQEESGALRAIFQECEGRLRTFCFLDPTANLLAYSEDLSAAVWEKDPMLQATASVSDPLGGQRATRLTNSGQTEQALWQALPVPAYYRYCLSAYVRSGAATAIQLFQRSGAYEYSKDIHVETAWTRAVCSGVAGGSENTLRFGLRLPAGAVIDVFGWQAEAQPGASVYKRTPAEGGVYPSARFTEDVLTMTEESPGLTSTLIIAKDT